MRERIRLINHHGKQVLVVDLSNCSAVEVEKIVRAVPEFVTTRPRGSVLILSDFTGASRSGHERKCRLRQALHQEIGVDRSRELSGSALQELKEFFWARISNFQGAPRSFGLAGEGLNGAPWLD